MAKQIKVWSGSWQSSYPEVTGTMKIPLYDVVDSNLEYSTYCETTYTGLYARGKTIRLEIEVTPGDPYPTLTAQNDDQTITYSINEIRDDGEMRGTYKSKSPNDTGYWSMS